MECNIIHIKIDVRGAINEFWVQKSMAFMILKKLLNNFVHHVDIQVKIFKPSPL